MLAPPRESGQPRLFSAVNEFASFDFNLRLQQLIGDAMDEDVADHLPRTSLGTETVDPHNVSKQ